MKLFQYLVISAVLGLIAMSSIAKTPAKVASPQPSRITNPASISLSNDDASVFFDGMMPSLLKLHDIAGATISVVKDGKIVFAKGYGMADIAKNKLVVADQTLFRPGSVSKLFTWTAVMQQVELGKIDLDKDINTYLDFKIPATFGKPITMRHLMTHTPGFEERNLDLIRYDMKRQVSLGDEVKRRIPEQIFAPGTIPAYSNYGTALAAYVVERVSGEKFEDYTERHIFAPLQMQHATFRQPVPNNLSDNLSQGYQVASQEPSPFEFVNIPNAGSLSVTATDMAQFMIAHLENGMVPSFGETSRIMRPGTMAMMHKSTNIVAPGIDAMALGFWEMHRNGHRIIAHGGNLDSFHSYLKLIPDTHTGFFISLNSKGKNSSHNVIIDSVFDSFMDRYLPQSTTVEPQVLSSHAAHSTALVGNYSSSRRSGHGIFSFLAATEQTKVSVNGKGFLEVDAFTDSVGNVMMFHEIGPWQWQQVNGQERLGANRNPDGTIQSFATMPIFISQPVSAWQNMTWLLPALVVSLAVLLVWLFYHIWRQVRWHILRDRREYPTNSINGRQFSRIGLLSALAFIALLVYYLAKGLNDEAWMISSESLPTLRTIQIISCIAVLGAIAAFYGALKAWKTPGRSLRSALGSGLIAFACATFAYVIIIFGVWMPTVTF
jgi:CubicO group peptidase (beta-lactamase class C family)